MWQYLKARARHLARDEGGWAQFIPAIVAALAGLLKGGGDGVGAQDPVITQKMQEILGEQQQRMMQQSGLHTMGTNLAGQLMPRSAYTMPVWPKRDTVNDGGGAGKGDRGRRGEGGGDYGTEQTFAAASNFGPTEVDPTLARVVQTLGRGFAPRRQASLFRLPGQ